MVNFEFRKAYEATFPVPDHVYYNADEGGYESDCEWAVSIAVTYDHKWHGYCAGYVASSFDKENKLQDALAVLQELIDLKDLKERIGYGPHRHTPTMIELYKASKPLAWEKARLVLSDSRSINENSLLRPSVTADSTELAPPVEPNKIRWEYDL